MFSSSAAQVSTAANYIEDVFSTYLYTGNGSSTTGQTIINNVDLSTKGGLVWIKCRDGANDHVLFDTARGAGTTASNNQALSSNLTLAEDIGSSIDYLSSFNADGFTVKRGGTYAPTLTANTSGTLYTSWTFRKQAKFFDVVTYTGSGVAGRTVAHNLGSVPGCIIVKQTDLTSQWGVYHRSLGNASAVYLNSTIASFSANFWNNTNPTSTNFTLPATFPNDSGSTYVAYLFAHDAGGFGASGSDNVISCGSFTTDGSGNATVSLGYEPQWLLVKVSSGTSGDWRLIDNMREFSLSSEAFLRPNSSAAETVLSPPFYTPTSTGFKLTGSDPSLTFIYIAIRRGPMKTPTSGTSVFSPVAQTGTSVSKTITGTTPTDMVFIASRGGQSGLSPTWWDRLRGANKYLQSGSTSSEVNSTTEMTGFDVQNGFTVGISNAGLTNASGWNYVYETFRRAPGFFDVVCYTGTGATGTQNHNLGVAPELMIVKQRAGTAFGDWFTYSSALGATKYLSLQATTAAATSSGAWNNTAPTSSVFTTGTFISVSAATFVAYLFASVAGVSKVGSYTGTGTTKQIDCGFTGGARFVLIKRTDSTGDWYVWDSARGIVAGNDPYLLLNSTAAEVTGTDYVDTYSLGFEISSTAPAAINANGGSFIFLAIA